MAFTFDGPNKLIILTLGTTAFSVSDCYSRWKEWVLLSDNSKYLEAMSAIGGDPLPGGAFLGTTFFMENGWKIRPQEANHTLAATGNLFDRSGGDVFVNTLGSYNVRVESRVSNLVDLVATGGSSVDPDDVADAVFNKVDTIWTGWNLQRATRHILAGIQGKTAGYTESTATPTAYAPDGTTPVFSGTVDTFGNRTDATYHV